jgi:hypothetical protein
MDSYWYIFLENKKKGAKFDVYAVRAQTSHNARALLYRELEKGEAKDKKLEKIYNGMELFCEVKATPGEPAVFFDDNAGTYAFHVVEMD